MFADTASACASLRDLQHEPTAPGPHHSRAAINTITAFHVAVSGLQRSRACVQNRQPVTRLLICSTALPASYRPAAEPLGRLSAAPGWTANTVTLWLPLPDAARITPFALRSGAIPLPQPPC